VAEVELAELVAPPLAVVVAAEVVAAPAELVEALAEVDEAPAEVEEAPFPPAEVLLEAAAVDEVELDAGGAGQVGSVMVTLTVPNAEHTWFSVPETRAAWTCSGEMSRPKTWLSAAITVKTLGLEPRSAGTRLNKSLRVQVRPPRRGQFSVATMFA